MAPVGMTPSFGQLTTSYARGPQAAQKFQNTEFNFISSMNNTPSGSAQKMDANMAADFQDIRQMQGEQGGKKGLYGKIVDFFVGQNINKAMNA